MRLPGSEEPGRLLPGRLEPGSRAGSEELRAGSDRKVLDSRERSMGARERGGSLMMRSTWGKGVYRGEGAYVEDVVWRGNGGRGV